jgi:CubicO group peptidase (beta-lactamase class C family)
MKSGFSLAEWLRETRPKAHVPGVAVGLSERGSRTFAADGVLAAGGDARVAVESPFRIASITKPFTARLCLASGLGDERSLAELSHTAGLRCESAEPLPAGAEGLWSYSNAGYWRAAARACGGDAFEDAMRERVLEPYGLAETGFEEPPRPARGHVLPGKPVLEDAYPRARRPSGGLWSTVGDLVAFGEALLRELDGTQFEPRGEAFGERYGLGIWVRELADGRRAFDHEGSVGGYQSLLLLVPDGEVVLAVLTNSSIGGRLASDLVDALGLAARSYAEPRGPRHDIAGRYELDDVDAVVDRSTDGVTVAVRETDPVTSTQTSWKATARPLGGTVYSLSAGTLMSHRVDFPREGFARIGWVVMPRVAS